MKKVVNILLAICIVALIYIVYGSIMNPIRFANEKKTRDQAVIARLMDIKAAQTEYNYQHSGFCDNFDTLAAFIKTAQLPITKKVGELTDDQLENNWTENKVLALYAKAQTAEQEAAKLSGRKAAQKQYEADTLWQRAAKEGFIEILEDGSKNFLFSRETEFVSLYDSLYHGRIDPDSLRYVPFPLRVVAVCPRFHYGVDSDRLLVQPRRVCAPVRTVESIGRPKRTGEHVERKFPF